KSNKPCCDSVNDSLGDFASQVQSSYKTFVDELSSATLVAPDTPQLLLQFAFYANKSVSTALKDSLDAVESSECSAECCNSASQALSAISTAALQEVYASIPLSYDGGSGTVVLTIGTKSDQGFDTQYGVLYNILLELKDKLDQVT